jgi:tRNA threonylcarbamoyladenosine biosynthesis protein TsaB
VKILAVDTSEPSGSAAVFVDGRAGGPVTLGPSPSHLVELGRAVDALTQGARIAVRDIDRIALVTGPGSFTGLRIGMAYVKGLYAAFKPEIVGITSLELLAMTVSAGGLPVAPMIDARKDEVYAALYRSSEGLEDRARGPAGGRVVLEELISPRALSPHEYLGSLDVRPTVFVGSGALRYTDDITGVFGGSAVFPAEGGHRLDTRLLCEIARGLDPLPPEDVISMEPFYVRPSDAILKPLKSIRTHEGN